MAGRAYAESADLAPFAAEGGRLDSSRLHALECLMDARLALEQDAELVGELEGLATAHPTRERFWQQWMTSLDRAGRRSDATEVFRLARHTLVEEYGLEPSHDLASTYQRTSHP